MTSTPRVPRICRKWFCASAAPIAPGDVRLEPHDAAGQLAFEILAVEGQIVDGDEMEGRFVGPELRERVRELAIDGIAAIAADDDGDLDVCHGKLTLGY